MGGISLQVGQTQLVPCVLGCMAQEFMQVIFCIFSPRLLGNFYRCSANGDGVTDGLPDGLIEATDDTWTERNFPRNWIFGKLPPAILVGIFTVNLADGWMDGTDDGHTDGWMEFQVESHCG